MELESAQQFVKDYEAAGFKESYSAYGAQSFDAANIIIQGLAKVLPNADSVEAARPEIVKAVGATSGYRASPVSTPSTSSATPATGR